MALEKFCLPSLIWNDPLGGILAVLTQIWYCFFKMFLERVDTMLTFEKVFEVFREYLDADDEFEIVKTRRGYTVLHWDNMGCDWYGVHLCTTPEALRDAVLSAYGTYLEYEIIKGRGYDLTEAEEKIVQDKCAVMLARCQ